MEREQLEKGLDALLFIDNINGPRTFLRRYASAGSSDRNVSVRPSVRLSVCHAPVLCQNEES